MEATNATKVSNTKNLSKAYDSNDVQPPVEPQSKNDVEESVSTHAEVHIGVA